MILEGWVVDQQNIQPRTVQSSPKRGKERSVIDYMCFDGTGPMKVSLWDEAAEEFLKLVNMQQTEEKVLIEVKGFRVNPVTKNEWNGVILTLMYIVNSLGATEFAPGTTVSRVTEAKSPYNQVSTKYLAPSPAYGLKQFLQMKTQSVPFRGSFIGSMVDVGELDVTSTGQPKRSFVLVDEM